MKNENENSELVELRKLLQQTIELVNQNAKDNAYLRGAFEQMDKRFEDFTGVVNRRFEQVENRLEKVEGQLSDLRKQLTEASQSQLKWIIGLLVPLWMALIALVVKSFLGS